MSQVEIVGTGVTTVVDNSVEITTSSTEATIDTATTKIVEIIPNNYVISSNGIYSSNSGIGAVPDWLQSSIDQGILDKVDGKIDITRLEESLRTLIQSLESGVAQNITDIETATLALSSLTTSVNASIGANDSSILAIEAAYVDEDKATSLAIDAMQAVFGGVGSDVAANAWFTSLNTATANATSANTNSLVAVNAAINDPVTGTEATATGVADIYARTGIDPVTGVFSAAGHTNDLAAAIGVDGGSSSASSGMHNTLYVSTERVESNFSYDVNTWIDGSYYDAGFGLKTTAGGTGTDLDPYNSEFWIDANRFKFSDGTIGHDVFVADANGVTFNGKVTFISNGATTELTGDTISSIATTAVEQVTVGDKNINITDNLIPTTSLISDVNNAGYQFVGDPIKSSAAGLDTFSEPQIVLDANDEVYSPYVDELTAAYYYRFGVYGVTDLSSFGVHTIDAVDAVTETNLVYNMLDGNFAAGTWYIVDGIINPNGGDDTAYSGSIRTADGTKIGEVQNIAMPADAEQMVLGWQFSATISRPKLAKITADTLTGSFATTEYVGSAVSAIDLSTYLQAVDFGPSGTTTVDGGRITAGTSITSPIVNGGTINGGTINGIEVNGGTINGVNINGSVIKASWIDYSSTGSLTNWKFYGPGLLPPDDTNFARDNVSNELIVTDQGTGPSGLGHYRLPCNVPITTTPTPGTTPGGNGTMVTSQSIQVDPWDSYTSSSADRFITEDGVYQVPGSIQVLAGNTDNHTCGPLDNKTNSLTVTCNGISFTFVMTKNASGISTGNPDYGAQEFKTTTATQDIGGITFECTSYITDVQTSDADGDEYNFDNAFRLKILSGSTTVTYNTPLTISYSLSNSQSLNLYNYITYHLLPSFRAN